MKNIVFSLSAAFALLFTTQVVANSYDSLDVKIEAAFASLEESGALNDLSDAQLDFVNNMVQEQIETLNLNPALVDQFLLGSLVKKGVEMVTGAIPKVIESLGGLAKKAFSKITGILGDKGGKIVSGVIDAAKGIDKGKVLDEVATTVATTAAGGLTDAAIQKLTEDKVKEAGGTVQ